jgi:hypothetical protein
VKTVQDPDRPSVAVGAQMAETLASSCRQRLLLLVRPFGVGNGRWCGWWSVEHPVGYLREQVLCLPLGSDHFLAVKLPGFLGV